MKNTTQDFKFLTSGICENTGHYNEDMMDALSLPSGEFDGDWYPLTTDEDRFIGDDPILLPDGVMVLLGYSIISGRTKFIAPAIEIDYEWELNDGEAPARTEAAARILTNHYKCVAEVIASSVQGGFVFEDEKHNGFIVSIALSLSRVEDMFADIPNDGKFSALKAWLEGQLTAMKSPEL